MLNARGYLVSQKELDRDKDSFTEEFGDDPRREGLTIMVPKRDDPSEMVSLVVQPRFRRRVTPSHIPSIVGCTFEEHVYAISPHITSTSTPECERKRKARGGDGVLFCKNKHSRPRQHRNIFLTTCFLPPHFFPCLPTALRPPNLPPNLFFGLSPPPSKYAKLQPQFRNSGPWRQIFINLIPPNSLTTQITRKQTALASMKPGPEHRDPEAKTKT